MLRFNRGSAESQRSTLNGSAREAKLFASNLNSGLQDTRLSFGGHVERLPNERRLQPRIGRD